MNDTNRPAATDRVTCPAAKDPIVRIFIGAAMAMGLGLWMVYDHYYQGKYPNPQPYELNKYLSYLTNHYLPFVFIPLGLALAAWAIVTMCRVLVADAEGLGYRGKTKHPWTAVASVDASRLTAKGVLVLHLQGGGKLVLDSWKLKNFKDLVAFVEAHLPPNVHIGM